MPPKITFGTWINSNQIWLASAMSMDFISESKQFIWRVNKSTHSPKLIFCFHGSIKIKMLYVYKNNCIKVNPILYELWMQTANVHWFLVYWLIKHWALNQKAIANNYLFICLEILMRFSPLFIYCIVLILFR